VNGYSSSWTLSTNHVMIALVTIHAEMSMDI
jgi:hypothetical protein